jgi:hypothetical protein
MLRPRIVIEMDCARVEMRWWFQEDQQVNHLTNWRHPEFRTSTQQDSFMSAHGANHALSASSVRESSSMELSIAELTFAIKGGLDERKRSTVTFG